MKSIPQSEIKAIGRLLKDSDESTMKLLEEQIKTFDINVLKEINDELPLDDITCRKHFLDLLLKMRRERLSKDFDNWSKNTLNDLEYGVFLVASFNNPLLSFEFYSNILSSWSNKLGQNLKNIKLKNDPTSIINEVNHFIFMELGFKGNKESYYDPENSFIDKVIEKKKGNPILLSTIYLLITKRLGLPFLGVNMPAHFLVQYIDTIEPIFIDPFGQGEIITRADCQERIKILKLTWQEDYLTSPNNKQIVTRMMQNLINIYNSEGLFELKEQLEYYVNIVKRNT